MPRTCRAPGCAAETSSRYSPYCSTHRGRLRRQGAVDQQAVTKAELARCGRLVQARIAKNPNSPGWSRLDDAWMHVVGHAKSIIAAEKQGKAGYRPERIAAREVVTLADEASPREVVVCTLAMFVMLEMEPRRFRSDDAFRVQLARRVRRLTEANASFYFDPVADKGKRVYRDLPPRAARLFASWLAEALGGAGLHLAQLEIRDIEKGKQHRLEMRAALAELK
jgi:hypothetical protein